MAHIHINDCNYVTISSLRINAPESSPNTDGIDVGSSSNVVIQDCVIGTGMKLNLKSLGKFDFVLPQSMYIIKNKSKF